MAGTSKILCLFLFCFRNNPYLCSDYEKSRNEKSRNMENPFKFGTIVEEEYFTDRIEEVASISQFLNSPNHLILISPQKQRCSKGC